MSPESFDPPLWFSAHPVSNTDLSTRAAVFKDTAPQISPTANKHVKYR